MLIIGVALHVVANSIYVGQTRSNRKTRRIKRRKGKWILTVLCRGHNRITGPVSGMVLFLLWRTLKRLPEWNL